MTIPPDVAGEFVEIPTGAVQWRFERAFLQSHWTCIWGRGCLGILDEPAPELQQGCCSIGAELGDQDDAMTVSAYAATLGSAVWQFHDAVDADDVFSDATRTNTKVVDGACIFLNRPGFAGGPGCALHLAALAADESPIDWKPSVCSQLPIHVDWASAARRARVSDGAPLESCRLGPGRRHDGVVLHRGGTRRTSGTGRSSIRSLASSRRSPVTR